MSHRCLSRHDPVPLQILVPRNSPAGAAAGRRAQLFCLGLRLDHFKPEVMNADNHSVSVQHRRAGAASLGGTSFLILRIVRSFDQMFAESGAATVGSDVPEIRTVAAITARHGVIAELLAT